MAKKMVTSFGKRSCDRIKSIVDEFCNGSQQELADRAGIDKSSISQYVHGKNTPSNLTSNKIAKPFGLNPAWVMGFDAPKYDKSPDPFYKTFSHDVEELLNAYNALSDIGKEKVLEIARLYALSEKEGR